MLASPPRGMRMAPFASRVAAGDSRGDEMAGAGGAHKNVPVATTATTRTSSVYVLNGFIPAPARAVRSSSASSRGRPSYFNAIPRRAVLAPLAGAARGTPRRTGPNPVITLGSGTPSPLQSKLPLSTTIVPSPTSVFAPVVTSNTAPTFPALRWSALPMNWLLQANCANMPALPAPLTRLARKTLTDVKTGREETSLDNRRPYEAAFWRVFRSKSLPVRSVAAIEFAQGPRTILSATTTLAPSRTRMPPNCGTNDDTVATIVFPTTLSPSVPS